MDENILLEAGFTKGEIRVYLALIEIGESSSGLIIDKSHISSSKVYDILEKLIQKGLVSYIYKEKIKFFQPASPKKLLDYIEKQKKKISITEKGIQKLVPILENKQKISQEIQSASVYEGYEGIKSVFNRILDSMNKGDEYYVFTLDESANSENFRLFLDNFHTKRIKKGINVKLLSMERYRGRFKERKLSQRKFINHTFPNGVYIFKNQVMHFMYRPKPTLFIMNSKQNYQNYRKFFLDVWKKANP